MNFRRQPFQFTTIDPAKRQAELQRRFGLPTNKSDMYLDFLNPNMMGSGTKEPSLNGGSPRLQHRVPVITENTEANSEQNNVDGAHKPRVRVVPIQVEGVDGGRCHRTFSGPAGMVDRNNGISNGRLQETFPHLNSTKFEENLQKPSQPRVCNIPIQIEGREKQPNVENARCEPKPKASEPAKKLKSELIGCAAGKEKQEEPDKSVSLKQIENVLNKLTKYKEEVEKFSGPLKNKQYRYLDEMLTRCMLDLDNVDTMGLNEIRMARKEAVRQVQHYVDLLDSKVNSVVEKMDSDNTVEESKETRMSADSTIPPSTEVNEVAESKEVKSPCDAEMSDVTPETNVVDSTNLSESNNVNEDVTSDDVEMYEKVSNGLVSEVTNDKMDISHQDEESISGVEAEMDRDQKQDTSELPVYRAEMDSTVCNEQDLKMKDSEICIEELDNNSETNDTTSKVIENVLCIVSQSPELGVKEPIAEEADTEIVIEEIDDCDYNRGTNDNEQSSSICDNSATNDKNLSEQSNACHSGDVVSAETSCASFVQEMVESDK